MSSPSSAPTGGAGRLPATRPGGPPRGPMPPPPNWGGPPQAGERPLTPAQRNRIVAASLVLVLIGALLGLLAYALLPKTYAAQASVRYSLGRGASEADRELSTQSVLMTSREVLQGAADATGVPVDYLQANTTATVVTNSEIIQVQVKHRTRATGVQLADAVTKKYLEVAEATSPRAAVQKQLDDLQKQLVTAPVAQQAELRLRVAAVQSQLDDLATTENLASIAAPAYSLPDPVFPNQLATIGIGGLIGVLLAALVATRMIRSARE
jgi:hypothetical protein